MVTGHRVRKLRRSGTELAHLSAVTVQTSSDRLDLGVGLSHRLAIHESLATEPATLSRVGAWRGGAASAALACCSAVLSRTASKHSASAAQRAGSSKQQ
jgi:hypothetical protein